jgi:ABC-type lipoprotein export system ATPase subunit
MQTVMAECHNLVKIYKVADLEVVALQGLDLRVAQGEMLAIAGPSGSGKTTLMHILGGLDLPSAGQCIVAGQDVLRLNAKERLDYRRRRIGNVWQQVGRNLLSHYSLRENVEIPQMALGVSATARTRRARDLLAQVGLPDMGAKVPAQLSGGEQQRAAIAVALANTPAILLADEPTGELDGATASEILALLRQLNNDTGITTVVVTHDPTLAEAMDRVIAIRDGRTSTEIVRRRAPHVAGKGSAVASDVIAISGSTHHELVLMDGAGRLQVPRDLLIGLPFTHRVEIRAAGDHLEIWPIGEETE